MSTPDLMSAPHCSATSKQTGKPCGAHVARGYTVCYWHGARAPQVRATAEERLRALVHPAISALERLIEANDLGAAKYTLDVAGFKPPDKVQQDGRVTLEIELVQVKRTLELPES